MHFTRTMCTCVINRNCCHCVTNFSHCNSINRNRKKKLNKENYKNHEIWPKSGEFLIFSSTEPLIVLSNY